MSSRKHRNALGITNLIPFDNLNVYAVPKQANVSRIVIGGYVVGTQASFNYCTNSWESTIISKCYNYPRSSTCSFRKVCYVLVIFSYLRKILKSLSFVDARLDIFFFSISFLLYIKYIIKAKN